MKGNNSIQINEATLIAAVQMYLDAQFRDGQAPEVTSVRPSSHDGCAVFTVTVTERDSAGRVP